MRLVGFLAGFVLVTTALFFVIRSGPTAVKKDDADIALSAIQHEKEDAPVGKSEQLDLVEFDRTKNKPGRETAFPKNKALPIIEPPPKILVGSTEKIQALNTIPVPRSGEEKKVDPNPHPVTQPINQTTTKIPTRNETIIPAKASEKTVRWHPFWGPFNTPGSAKSFAKALAKKTDLDIRIKETRPDRYIVMYPYRSKNDRQESALLIERKTGLRVAPK